MTSARPIKFGSGGSEEGSEGYCGGGCGGRAGMMDLRPPLTASGRADVVATLVSGGDGGGGARQRVQHRRVSIAEYGEYAEYTTPPLSPLSKPSPQPRQHPQQIEVGGMRDRGFWLSP